MRSARVLLLASLSCTVVACSSKAELPTNGGAAPLPGPAAWNRTVVPPADDAAATTRLACGYKAGSLPAETQGASHPSGTDIPVDHILVMMMENRSFDHYFQALPAYGQTDVEIAPDTFSNPDPQGAAFPIYHDTNFCFVDTNHEWGGAHQQVNGGAMDGFYASNEGYHELPAHGTLDMLSGQRAMGYYDADDLPFYYWLANEFSIADHYHSSLLGPTFPNRMYLYAASSFGKTWNTLPTADTTLPDYLEQRQINWTIYSAGTPGFAIFLNQFLKYQAIHVKTLDQYFTDAAAGNLPQFAFVDPVLLAENYDQNDEHPPAIANIGQALVASVVDALMKSPNWSRSAMFITYDEHGGLYDHVVPPKACPPDDIAPELDPTDPNADFDPTAGFDSLGIRVPMTLVSPFAKKHFVGHDVYDHTSIVRFVEARFVIPALSNRDANAEAPWEMFDFANAPHATPPEVTMPTVDPTTVADCAKIFVP